MTRDATSDKTRVFLAVEAAHGMRRGLTATQAVDFVIDTMIAVGDQRHQVTLLGSLAAALERAGRWSDALGVLHQCVSMDVSASAWFAVAETMRRAGVAPGDLGPTYEQALLAVDPSRWTHHLVLHRLADIAVDEGRYAKAAKLIQQSMQTVTHNRTGFPWLAVALRLAKQEQATTVVRKYVWWVRHGLRMGWWDEPWSHDLVDLMTLERWLVRKKLRK